MDKLAFVFPGQGSHYVGMSKGIYDEFKIVRETFEEAEDILKINLTDLCFNGPLSTLTKVTNAHAAILTSGISAFRVFMQEIGYAPQFCAGHSLGEYLALTSAGVLSFADALKLVEFRAGLTKNVEQETNGGMTIIDNIETTIVEEECKKAQEQGKKVYISCYNSPIQTAISGDLDDLFDFEYTILSRGGQITPLIGSAPYHSPLMINYAKELEKELERYTFHDFRYAVISNYTGEIYRSIEEVKKNLVLHLTNPVKWSQSMKLLERRGVNVAIEMGPKNLITNIVRSNSNEISAICLGNKKERNEFFTKYKTHEMYSKHIPTIITKCLVAGVATPNKNWDNDEYEAGVVKPYNEIQSIQNKIESKELILNDEIIRKCLENLKTIFITKKLPESEQKEWLTQMLEETGLNYQFKDILL